jgi:hypothetical protein
MAGGNGHPPRKHGGHRIAAYLKHLDPNLNLHYVRKLRRVLASLVQQMRLKPLSACKPLDLVNWVKAHTAWHSPWTMRRVSNSVQRPFSWGEHMGLIDRNLFRSAPGLPPPRPTQQAETGPATERKVER